eukprot:TRINITY_DN84096_c0_g1_i1.p2 TRINITY_DN84096_c0_g1~~TRINITY_DN84096_c0_g1_i1.p2  ORF type:complete len:150 (-),score=36.59 TRINITY_DN84096_c0_g1_i1:83-532(-)
MLQRPARRRSGIFLIAAAVVALCIIAFESGPGFVAPRSVQAPDAQRLLLASSTGAILGAVPQASWAAIEDNVPNNIVDAGPWIVVLVILAVIFGIWGEMSQYQEERVLSRDKFDKELKVKMKEKEKEKAKRAKVQAARAAALGRSRAQL